MFYVPFYPEFTFILKATLFSGIAGSEPYTRCFRDGWMTGILTDLYPGSLSGVWAPLLPTGTREYYTLNYGNNYRPLR